MSQASGKRSETARNFPVRQGGEAGKTPTGESAARQPREIGGRKGPEPTRYGDWEKNGRCIDF